MEKRKVESLRDLAIAHFPKAREQRAQAIQFASHSFADSALQAASTSWMTDAKLTAVEKQARDLLQLTFMHPEAQAERPFDWDPVKDAEHIARDAQRLADSVELQPQIEVAIVDAARLLCELTGDALPPWVDAAPAQTATPAPEVVASDGPAPLSRFAAQEAAVLGQIRKLGYDPLTLPKNKPGKAGTKCAVRNALSKDRLFTGAKVFDKAWERLSANGEIVIQS